MNIDWSKAPGATHYTPPLDDSGMWCAVFWRKEGDGFPEAWQVRDTGELINIKKPTVMPDTPDRMIARPAAWLGEGLPPVGTVCEAYKALADVWVEVKIIDHQGSVETCAVRERGLGKDSLWWSQKFRPIRTPEQLAAEEKGRAVTDMLRIVSSPGLKGRGVTAQLEALYDANYRKFEIVEGE